MFLPLAYQWIALWRVDGNSSGQRVGCIRHGRGYCVDLPCGVDSSTVSRPVFGSIFAPSAGEIDQRGWMATGLIRSSTERRTNRRDMRAI
jgi:hypothetical protein